MKRTSLDGKRWSPPARPDVRQSTALATLGSAPSDRINLREASPPKKNPWQRNRPPGMMSVIESHTEDFPLPSVTASTDAPSVSTVAVTPTNTAASVAESRRSSSRASSFSTPDAGAISPAPSRNDRGRNMTVRSPAMNSPAVSNASPQRCEATSELRVSTPGPELEPEPEPEPVLTLMSPPTIPKKDEPDTPSVAGSDKSLTNLDGLWKNPVGADIHVRTAVKSFFVHRDVVTSQSGWFKDNVPPPPADGSMVTVHLNCAPETAAYGLRFMYTHRIEICDNRQPFNPAHLPRCALAYCAAVSLRIKGMVTHILRIIEATTGDLASALSVYFLNPEREHNWWVEFGEAHLSGALEIVYGQPAQELMKPLRLALAGVVDATLFWLLAQPSFREALESESWRVWLPKVLADVVEYRHIKETLSPRRMTVVPEDVYLDSLMAHPALKGALNVVI